MTTAAPRPKVGGKRSALIKNALARGTRWPLWSRDFRKTCAERSPGDVELLATWSSALTTGDRARRRPASDHHGRSFEQHGALQLGLW